MTSTVQLASALALLLSFALMHAAPRGTAIRLCALQGLAAALAAGLQALAHAAPPLAFAALLAAALNGVAMPFVLLHLDDRSGTQPSAPKSRDTHVSAVAIVLTTLSIAAAMHTGAGDAVPLFAAGLAVLLLGLLLITMQRHRDVPVLALLSAQNGMVLAASAVPNLSAVTTLICMVPIVPGLLTLEIWLSRLCQHSLTPE